MNPTARIDNQMSEVVPGCWAQRVGVPGDGPATIVICVHGTGGNGREELVDRAPFADAAFREAGTEAILVAPSYDVPYHFLIPDLGPRLIAIIQHIRDATPTQPGVRLWGFSGGAQFAHRFALQSPAGVDRVAAFASGEWTAPDGRHDGMMSRTDWFEREPFLGHAGLRDAAAVAAAPNWQHVRWLVGCGNRDTPDRIETAHWFAAQLRDANPAGDIHFLDYDGDHNHNPPEAHRAAWAFLAEP